MRLADVRAIRYGDVLVDGGRWPGFLHVVEHPQGRVLVDTGLIDSTPGLDEEWPRFDPDAIPREVACVINTHLHFDHCGGNRLFPGTPIYVQRLEREAARAKDYTIPEWVDFKGATYVELEGDHEVLRGLRLVPTPGHSPGQADLACAPAGATRWCDSFAADVAVNGPPQSWTKRRTTAGVRLFLVHYLMMIP